MGISIKMCKMSPKARLAMRILGPFLMHLCSLIILRRVTFPTIPNRNTKHETMLLMYLKAPLIRAGPEHIGVVFAVVFSGLHEIFCASSGGLSVVWVLMNLTELLKHSNNSTMTGPSMWKDLRKIDIAWDICPFTDRSSLIVSYSLLG